MMALIAPVRYMIGSLLFDTRRTLDFLEYNRSKYDSRIVFNFLNFQENFARPEVHCRFASLNRICTLIF